VVSEPAPEISPPVSVTVPPPPPPVEPPAPSPVRPAPSTTLPSPSPAKPSPAVASPAAPSPPPVAKPPVTPEPPQAPPPPVVAARVPNEDQIAQEVNQRVTKAQEIIDKIDAGKLSRDQREILLSIQDFVEKARDAYQAKDIPRAQVLAEKASKLAEDLAAAVKR
jgi:hypothetical protein